MVFRNLLRSAKLMRHFFRSRIAAIFSSSVLCTRVLIFVMGLSFVSDKKDQKLKASERSVQQRFAVSLEKKRG